MLPSLGLNECEEKLIEQSRQAFLLVDRFEERENDIETINTEIIHSDSENEATVNEMANIHQLLDETGKRAIEKKALSIRRKARAKANKLITEKRLLKRKIGKRCSKILRDFPDIGHRMEAFVKDCNVGADAWRRTGVLTFDGN